MPSAVRHNGAAGRAGAIFVPSKRGTSLQFTSMRSKSRWIGALLGAAWLTSCNGASPPAEQEGGTPGDAVLPPSDADAPEPDAAQQDAGSESVDVSPPSNDARDATSGDVVCYTCDPLGGQYCGTIGEGCSRRALMCGNQCRQPGFTCGGGGVFNVCGAARDSGRCEVTSCDTSGGTYCGRVGDGCGGTLDCGACALPSICAAGGTTGICGRSETECTRLSCSNGAARYCGVVGNGCGGRLDCGECPESSPCGETIAHMCGSDPPASLAPPVAPEPPPPPGPPQPPPPPT